MTTLELAPNKLAQKVEIGPLIEAGHICAGLDYYKPTMSQLAYEVEPNAEVTFTFKNRGEQVLRECIDAAALQNRFDSLRDRGFSSEELDYFASLRSSDNERIFTDDYLKYLKNNKLPRVNVLNDETGDISIESTGNWALVTFWETVVMSEVNEAYFEGYIRNNGVDPMALYEEGEKRLNDKIAILNGNPDIKFSDFGTRRHFSLRWQKYVVDKVKRLCPDNFLGTSNVELSARIGKKPIGTYAHEMPMVFAGLADARGEDVRSSHNKFLNAWHTRYGNESAIALTDTFGSKFFFADFTKEQAKEWRGLRHDSADPVVFGESVLNFYENHNIDPLTKTIVFSDGLDLDSIIALHEHFKGRINVIFGWGTTFTNDLGIKPLNVVMKATHVKDTISQLEADTVKLSDDPGKHTGTEDLVKLYEDEYFSESPRTI